MKRILMVSFRPPYPLTEGFKLRAYHLGRLLARHYGVDLLTLQDRSWSAEAQAALSKVFRRVIGFPHAPLRARLRALTGLSRREPLQVSFYRCPAARRWLQAHQKEYNLFWGFHLRTAWYLKGLEAPKVLDLIDAASSFYQGAYRHSAGLWRRIYRLESARLPAYEAQILRTFDRTFVASRRDAEHLASLAADRAARLIVLPNGVREELLGFAPAANPEPWLVFLGKMDYAPNVDAACFFATQIFPRLKAAQPQLEFWILGVSPRPEVWALSKIAGVHVTGYLEDPFSLVHRAALVVTPLRYGAGVQNKNLEAMALGKAVVTTPAGALGIAGQPGVHFRVVDQPSDWIPTILELLEDPTQRQALGRRAQELIRRHYRWEHVGRKLLTALEDLL